MKVKVSPKYQVVIPEMVRKILDLKVGSLVDVMVKGKVAFIVPLRSIESIQKTLKGKLSLKELRDKKDRI